MLFVLLSCEADLDLGLGLGDQALWAESNRAEGPVHLVLDLDLDLLTIDLDLLTLDPIYFPDLCP